MSASKLEWARQLLAIEWLKKHVQWRKIPYSQHISATGSPMYVYQEADLLKNTYSTQQKSKSLPPCRSIGIAEIFFPLLISVLQPSIQSYFPFFSLVFKTPNASSTVFFLFPQQSPWSLNNFFAFFSQHRDEIFSPQSHRKIAGQSRNRHSTGSSETWMWPHHQDASRLQATYTHCKLLNGFQASRCQDTWKHY